MTPAQLPVWLQGFADRARERAAVDAANAMAHTYQRLVVASMHGPSPSPPGTPPGRRSGTLARSVRVNAAGSSKGIALGGARAASSVAPHTVYARIQQLGGHIYPVRAKALHWTTPMIGPLRKGQTRRPSVGIFAKHVYLPPRPYFVMPPQRRRACLNAGRDAALRAVNDG